MSATELGQEPRRWTIEEAQENLAKFLSRRNASGNKGHRSFPWAISINIETFANSTKRMIVIYTSDTNACHDWMKIFDCHWLGHRMVFADIFAPDVKLEAA